MFSTAKIVSTVALLVMLAPFGDALHPQIQSRVISKYTRWLPGYDDLRYEVVYHDQRIIDHLRGDANEMGIAELAPTENHRHFIIPFDLPQQSDRFGSGLTKAAERNYFAVFQMPLDSRKAILNEIGSVVGAPREKLKENLRLGRDLFSSAEYGIKLRVA